MMDKHNGMKIIGSGREPGGSAQKGTRQRSKLVLRRETLRSLREAELRGVAGGYTSEAGGEARVPTIGQSSCGC